MVRGLLSALAITVASGETPSAEKSYCIVLISLYPGGPMQAARGWGWVLSICRPVCCDACFSSSHASGLVFGMVTSPFVLHRHPHPCCRGNG